MKHAAGTDMKLFRATVHARWLSAAVLLPLLFAVASPAQSGSSDLLEPAGESAFQAATPLLWSGYPAATMKHAGHDFWWEHNQVPGSAHRPSLRPSLAMLDLAGYSQELRQPVAFKASSPAANKRGASSVLSEADSQPEFVSTPPTTVRVGTRYEYQAEAISDENLPLTYSLATAPRLMRVDAETGLVEWQPAAGPGNHAVELVVRDENGGEARQAWTLRVLRPNEPVSQPPRITSQPPTSATIDQPWIYQMVVEDPDDDIERFGLVQGPVGMRINSETGRVDWTPANVGDYPVTVEVVDETGLRDEQSFSILVSAAPGVNPPQWQSPDTLTAPLGRTTRFQLAATDLDGDDLNYFAEPLPLPKGMRMNSLTGEFEFTPSLNQVGDHQLMLAASDGRFRVYQDFTVTVPPPEGPTGLRGRIQNGPEDGLPDVRLVLGMGEAAIEIFSDADGYFQFDDLDLEELAGPGVLEASLRLLVDGAATGTAETFATVPKEMHVIAGADNVLDAPMILMPLDTASADPVDPGRTSAITSAPVEKGGELFAEITLTIPPGTARWEDTGELFDGMIHITDIPDNDLSPQPLPPELDFSVYVAMQPFGVIYDEPVPISFPNVNKLLPGTRMEVFGLDHDTGEFVKFGDAEVSTDGQTVDSIGGVVVANSWHGVVFTNPEVENESEDSRDEEDCECGSTVGMTEGNLNVTHTTPFYQSLGQARGITLSYNHITANAKPIVRFQQGNAFFSVSGPATGSASLNVGGVAFSPRFSWEGSVETSQGAIQFDATGCPSEVYDFELEVTSSVPGGFGARTTTVGGKLALINLADSPYGKGWHIQGLEEIIIGPTGDALIIDGRSQGTIFRLENGGFTSPDGDFSTLTMTEGGLERRFSDGMVKVFGQNGLLIAEQDRNGNTTTYTYDEAGRLLIATDPVGLQTTFSYFAGMLASISDPAGRVTRFEHDAFGNLTRIIEPGGGIKAFSYDGPKGRLLARTDQRGFTTEYQYNQFGRLEAAFRPDGSNPISRATAQVGLIDPETGNGTEENPAQAVLTDNVDALLFDGNGNLTRLKTDARGRITERIDAVGRVFRTERDIDSNPTRTTRSDGSMVTRTFDDRGNVLTETEQANGATTAWTYDSFDQVISMTDPRGHTTTYERDARGELTRIVNPLGHEITMEYNTQGLMSRRVDPDGLEAVQQYNAHGLVSSRTETPADAPDNARTTTFEYTAFGEVAKITTPTGTVLNFTYDAVGRPIEITDNLGQRQIMAYDTADNLVRIEIRAVDGSLVTLQEQAYDEQNRLIEARSPHSEVEDSVTLFAYDGEGNQTGIIDPNGRISVREYDAIDRLVRELSPAGDLIEFDYDARSQLNRVSAPNNATTTFEFDLLSRQTAEHSPDRGTITQEYDPTDNLSASTDARGIRREMTYDELNRLKTVTFPESGEDIIYTYDNCSNGTGRICRIDDESGTLVFEYDGFGNITRTTRTELGIEYVTDYEHDLEDRITAIVYPSGRRVVYGRDILGRDTEVWTQVAGQMQLILSDIQYRADGQITAATFGNGLVERREYDLQGRLTHQVLHDAAGLIVDERHYTYDPAGNITARTGTPGDQYYNYDALDRLTGQDIQTDGKNWQYDYGPNHNRLTRADGNLLSEIYSYQPQTNRLTEIDKLLGQTDQATPRSRQFIYNQANRFSEYIEDGETVVRYIYNALGQRTRKELNPATTLFHYGTRAQLLSETDGEGNTGKEYIWLGTRPIAQVESTGLLTYLHTDHLLTQRLGTSDAQTIVWSWEGEAFGEATAQGPMEVNLRFPGQYFDSETGRHYNYFRDYDPGAGQYVQSDPIGLGDGPNTYGYAGGNPAAWLDPYGLNIMDPVWGAVYRASGGRSPSQSVVDFSAGMGDAASLGLTHWMRNLHGTNDQVDKCSRWYIGGTVASAALVPTGRLGYVVQAARIPRLARTGPQAVEMRNLLRFRYRGPLTRIPFFANWHMRTYASFAGIPEAQIIANAGNVSRAWNAGMMGGSPALTGLAAATRIDGCGC